MKIIGALATRVHAPLSMRTVDVTGTLIGVIFLVITLLALLSSDYVLASATALGGAYLIADARRNRREVHYAVWSTAECGDDPIGILALCEHLYRAPLSDLVVMAEWCPGQPIPHQMREAARVQREAVGRT